VGNAGGNAARRSALFAQAPVQKRRFARTGSSLSGSPHFSQMPPPASCSNNPSCLSHMLLELIQPPVDDRPAGDLISRTNVVTTSRIVGRFTVEVAPHRSVKLARLRRPIVVSRVTPDRLPGDPESGEQRSRSCAAVVEAPELGRGWNDYSPIGQAGPGTRDRGSASRRKPRSSRSGADPPCPVKYRERGCAEIGFSANPSTHP
jgi:hypothetical protein